MKLSVIAITMSFIAVTVAHPLKRQNSGCSIDGLSAFSVVTSSDPNGKIRWDVFQSPILPVQQGDLGWFKRNNPSSNEKFKATKGPGNSVFAFSAVGGGPIGISGVKLTTTDTPSNFIVSCSRCDDFAQNNDLAADGCTFQFTNGDDTQGNGQCMKFTGENSGVILSQCDANDSTQFFGLFHAK